MVPIAYKVKLDLTEEQKQIINTWLITSELVYNDLINKYYQLFDPIINKILLKNNYKVENDKHRNDYHTYFIESINVFNEKYKKQFPTTGIWTDFRLLVIEQYKIKYQYKKLIPCNTLVDTIKDFFYKYERKLQTIYIT